MQVESKATQAEPNTIFQKCFGAWIDNDCSKFIKENSTLITVKEIAQVNFDTKQDMFWCGVSGLNDETKNCICENYIAARAVATSSSMVELAKHWKPPVEGSRNFQHNLALLRAAVNAQLETEDLGLFFELVKVYPKNQWFYFAKQAQGDQTPIKEPTVLCKRFQELYEMSPLALIRGRSTSLGFTEAPTPTPAKQEVSAPKAQEEAKAPEKAAEENKGWPHPGQWLCIAEDFYSPGQEKVKAAEAEANMLVEEVSIPVQEGMSAEQKSLQKNTLLAAQAQAKEEANPNLAMNFKYHKGPISPYFQVNGINRSLDHHQKLVGPWQTGISSTQGKRPTMEDTDIAEADFVMIGGNKIDFQLFGVFDGHGGSAVSRAVKHQIMASFKTQLAAENGISDGHIFRALKKTFKELDKQNLAYREQGTCATTAVIINGKVYVANVGDSRTILVKQNGETVQASEDAKPTSPRFKKKIYNHGGTVFFGGRVDGDLATARAIGDHRFMHSVNGEAKKCVVPDPKITCYSLEDFINGYLILACDGVYDVAISKEVGNAVHEMAVLGKNAGEMAPRIVEGAIRNGSTDNVSAMVVYLGG